MSNWQTILVNCFTVQGTGHECPKEFSDFDEATEFLGNMREEHPDGWFELIAVVDA